MTTLPWQIRHSEVADAAQIRDIYAQPSNLSGTLQLPFSTLAQWQQRLAAGRADFFSLVAEQDGKIFGQLGLQVFEHPRRRHCGNIGLAVCECHRRQGIGRALICAALELAFQWLALRRIELEVYTDNEAALALYQSLGFVIEGRAQDYAFRDGVYVDVYLMALTREGTKAMSKTGEQIE
ncbi:acetyltransferase [Shewanella sp. NFH-SH190041]|uniref:GNAT family N-acetyltransferase n=1 Tax=Shewanella sp. NFH-SH190041 TaxID=2950245 RepID=UPI0021C2F84F|nr:GNAT family N-acetyltransferase [Shewanella sp. NFH-SH190041]BDM65074.1 acetyltransferase [Shewanella sp. NFH-SH190041]